MTTKEQTRQENRARRLLSTPLNGGVMPIVRVEVFGTPRPQGSLQLIRAKAGHEVAKYAPTVYEWRGIVTSAVREVWKGPLLDGPLHCSIVFELARPLGHYGTGRNAGRLRPSAPLYPAVAPDLDKLVRAVLDSVTAAGTVWHDDGQVCRLVASKMYVPEGSTPGCTITITRVEGVATSRKGAT